MEKEIYLWRNTVKTASQDGKAFEFCRQNSILGVGWCLRNPAGMEIISQQDLIEFIYRNKDMMPGRIRQWL